MLLKSNLFISTSKDLLNVGTRPLNSACKSHRFCWSIACVWIISFKMSHTKWAVCLNQRSTWLNTLPSWCQVNFMGKRGKKSFPCKGTILNIFASIKFSVSATKNKNKLPVKWSRFSHSVIKIIFCLIYSSKSSLKWDCIFMQRVCQMGNTELG